MPRWGSEGHHPVVQGVQEQGGRLELLLGEVGVLAADLATDLSAYAADVEADPTRLAGVQSRIAALRELTRRYGDDISAVLAHRDESRQRLLRLQGADERIEELTEQVAASAALLAERVVALTHARTEAAERLSAAVEQELGHLGMAFEGHAAYRVNGEVVRDTCARVPDGALCDAWRKRRDETEVAWRFARRENVDRNRAEYERAIEAIGRASAGRGRPAVSGCPFTVMSAR